SAYGGRIDESRLRRHRAPDDPPERWPLSARIGSLERVARIAFLVGALARRQGGRVARPGPRDASASGEERKRSGCPHPPTVTRTSRPVPGSGQYTALPRPSIWRTAALGPLPGIVATQVSVAISNTSVLLLAKSVTQTSSRAST